MDFDAFVATTKIVALLLFVVVFTGACFWAFSGKKSEFDRYSNIPFQED
jgi:cbb3-type cytochrome oxidase subunit 3